MSKILFIIRIMFSLSRFTAFSRLFTNESNDPQLFFSLFVAPKFSMKNFKLYLNYYSGRQLANITICAYAITTEYLSKIAKFIFKI